MDLSIGIRTGHWHTSVDRLGKMFEFVLQEMKNSVSFAKPPLLDDKNYSYWKVRVKAYIKVIDESAWRSILIGWTPSIVTTNNAMTSKLEETWSKKESALATANFKTLKL